MSSNKRRRGNGGEALPSVSYKKFCHEVDEHDTKDVAGLPEVYTVYRSLCENGLWKSLGWFSPEYDSMGRTDYPDGETLRKPLFSVYINSAVNLIVGDVSCYLSVYVHDCWEHVPLAGSDASIQRET
eukprot:120863-Prorocentrum_minimum.AAC.2